MKPARDCKDRLDDIVAFVMGEIDAASAEQLQAHLETCDSCRAACDALVEEENEIRSGFAALAASLAPIEQSLLSQQGRHPSERVGTSNNHLTERIKRMIRTHKRLIATAATLAALAAGLVFYVSVLSSTRPAYAMEQTTDANNHVRTFRVRCTPVGGFGELGEAWVQVNPDGTPLRARMEFPKSADGPKVAILTADKVEIWFKAKKTHVFVTEKNALAQMTQLQKQIDPRTLFDTLQTMKQKGEVEIDTQEPKQQGDPILLTVTDKHVNKRVVVAVDPSTKLVERATLFVQQDGDWKQMGVIECFDYNQDIDPAVFQLEVPNDVTLIDQINNPVGMEVGDLTNDEIATKVVKEFFEALIAEDYGKAGILLEGTPADKMKEMLGRFKFLRIVEIGKPLAGKHPDPAAVQVPAKIEWQANGQQEIHEFTPYVRPVYGHPDRRVICGGI